MKHIHLIAAAMGMAMAASVSASAATTLPLHESHVIMNVLKITLGHNVTATQFQVAALDVLCDGTGPAPRCSVRDYFSPGSARTVTLNEPLSTRLMGAIRGFFPVRVGSSPVYRLPQLFCTYTRDSRVYECADMIGKTN